MGFVYDNRAVLPFRFKIEFKINERFREFSSLSNIFAFKKKYSFLHNQTMNHSEAFSPTFTNDGINECCSILLHRRYQRCGRDDDG